jgi:hypothetical protein
MPILGTFLISRKAQKAGPLAEREGDVFSKSRASSLVKGFENAAPAWLDQARPCFESSHPCISVASVVPIFFNNQE